MIYRNLIMIYKKILCIKGIKYFKKIIFIYYLKINDKIFKHTLNLIYLKR
jgi:hypothetical protein